MLRGRFFSHRGLGGDDVRDRVAPTGYIRAWSDWRLAETIGWGSGARATPTAMVRAWMRSPPHRAGLLEPDYRQAGVGVVRGSPGGKLGSADTYTAVLGRR